MYRAQCPSTAKRFRGRNVTRIDGVHVVRLFHAYRGLRCRNPVVDHQLYWRWAAATSANSDAAAAFAAYAAITYNMFWKLSIMLT